MGIFEGQTNAKKSDFKGEFSSPKHVGILGAGLMGAGIGQVSATKGFKVLLKDTLPAQATKGVDYIAKNLSQKLKKRRMSSFDFNQAISNVVPLHDDLGSWKKHFTKS